MGFLDNFGVVGTGLIFPGCTMEFYLSMYLYAGVAVEREEPAWMNRQGNVCKEKDVFGCKVMHDITDPDYILVVDEVGRNISQKGDGYLCG